MKKVELLEAEVAVLSDLTRREIERTAKERREEQRETLVMPPQPPTAMRGQATALDYYTERLHMLRQLKAKLEREEE